MLFLCLVSEQGWFDLIWRVVFSCRHFIWRRMMENVYSRMTGMVESLWTSNPLQKASLKISKFYLKNDDRIGDVLLQKELWNNTRAFFKHLNNMEKELWLFSVVPEENLMLWHFLGCRFPLSKLIMRHSPVVKRMGSGGWVPILRLLKWCYVSYLIKPLFKWNNEAC